jgi:hypothetical protein
MESIIGTCAYFVNPATNPFTPYRIVSVSLGPAREFHDDVHRRIASARGLRLIEFIWHLQGLRLIGAVPAAEGPDE